MKLCWVTFRWKHNLSCQIKESRRLLIPETDWTDHQHPSFHLLKIKQIMKASIRKWIKFKHKRTHILLHNNVAKDRKRSIWGKFNSSADFKSNSKERSEKEQKIWKNPCKINDLRNKEDWKRNSPNRSPKKESTNNRSYRKLRNKNKSSEET